jgi:hypothetical protein
MALDDTDQMGLSEDVGLAVQSNLGAQIDSNGAVKK